MAESETPAPRTTTAAPVAEPRVRPAAGKAKPKQLPPFNVVLLDDDEHTYDYVIEMLGKVFGYGTPRALQMAKEVDKSGRVIVMTTHKERAELKRDQILSFGRDARIEACLGSMKAIVEPAFDS